MVQTLEFGYRKVVQPLTKYIYGELREDLHFHGVRIQRLWQKNSEINKNSFRNRQKKDMLVSMKL